MARFRAGIRMRVGDPGKMSVRNSGPQVIHRKGRRTRGSPINRGKRMPVRSRGPWIHMRGSRIDRGKAFGALGREPQVIPCSIKVFEAPCRSTWIHTRAITVSPHHFIYLGMIMHNQ